VTNNWDNEVSRPLNDISQAEAAVEDSEEYYMHTKQLLGTDMDSMLEVGNFYEWYLRKRISAMEVCFFSRC